MKGNIIVLEDNREIRELIEFLLTHNGYTVTSFENVGDFTAHFQGLHPDLIILDVMLPDGNGILVCESLKADAKTRDIPVVLMSANARMESIESAGAQDFIAKPFDINNFINRVDRQIAC